MLGLLAHADPGVGDDHIRALDRLPRVAHEVHVDGGLVARRARRDDLVAEQKSKSCERGADVRAVSDGRHKTITLALPVDAGTLLLSRPGATGPSTVRLTVTRETEDGVQSFNRNVRLQGAQQATQSLTP